MALNFPDSPVDGQIFETFYWDNTAGVWKTIVDDFDLGLAANFSNTPTGTYTDGFDYKYISFTADGVLTVTRGGYADILLVGGGGAGANWGGGGGGAGGVLYLENAYIAAGSLDVVVGAGGQSFSPPVQYASHGEQGKPSSLGSYFVLGGGGGGAPGYQWNSTTYYAQPAPDGASGGGTSVYNAGGAGIPGSGINGIGNNGGTAYLATYSGGGGGAGSAANAAASGVPGNGGNGIANSITGSSVIYGGGGGGIGGGTGGTGGGGTNSAGTDGLGGGGAGIGGLGTTYAGGSGIVIVRVKV